MKYSAVQFNTAQCSTGQCIAVYSLIVESLRMGNFLIQVLQARSTLLTWNELNRKKTLKVVAASIGNLKSQDNVIFQERVFFFQF